jgi:hypothetical protein
MNFRLVITVLLCFEFLCLGIIGGALLVTYLPRHSNIISENSYKYTNCTDLNLSESAYCLRDRLLGFYKYNISNIDKELTLDELKEQGGVCSHYSKWYITEMEKNGFNAEYVVFPLNETINHAIAIASNSEAYCILDQRAVNCWRMKI